MKNLPNQTTSKKKTTPNRDTLVIENSDLKNKLKVSTENFDKLQSKFSQQKKLIVDKEEQINLLQCELDKMKEFSENLESRQVESIIPNLSEEQSCASCKSLGADMAEMKLMLIKMQESVRNLHFEYFSVFN